MLNRAVSHIWISIVYGCLYIPLLCLMVNSLNSARFGASWAQFTLHWYRQLITNHTLLEAASRSILLAALSATLATILGLFIAVFLNTRDLKGKWLLSGALFFLMTAPDIVLAISLLALFALLGIPLGFNSLLLAHMTFSLPFVVLMMNTRLSTFDVRLLEAARDLGASEVAAFRKIAVPLMWPALLSSWLLAFTLSIDDVVISTFLTSPNYETLPLKIYAMVRIGLSPEVNALATIMFFFSLGALYVSQRLLYSSAQKSSWTF